MAYFQTMTKLTLSDGEGNEMHYADPTDGGDMLDGMLVEEPPVWQLKLLHDRIARLEAENAALRFDFRPLLKKWPDIAIAQMDGHWFRLGCVLKGHYVVVDGPFGTYQQALLSGREA